MIQCAVCPIIFNNLCMLLPELYKITDFVSRSGEYYSEVRTGAKRCARLCGGVRLVSSSILSTPTFQAVKNRRNLFASSKQLLAPAFPRRRAISPFSFMIPFGRLLKLIFELSAPRLYRGGGVKSLYYRGVSAVLLRAGISHTANVPLHLVLVHNILFPFFIA